VNQFTDVTTSAAGSPPDATWKDIGGGEYQFPEEYSVSGWWKWTGPYTTDFHINFRLMVNGKPDNADHTRMGDRALCVWSQNNN